MNAENQLIITEEEGDTIEVFICPDKMPIVYARKKKELIEISGMTETEAEKYLEQPIVLELLYDFGRGLFAVEYEALDSIDIYNPYTGEEISKEADGTRISLQCQ